MKAYTYLLIDLACLIIPLIASFYRKHSFFREWKYFFPANLIVAIGFLIWDVIFTEKGIWGFNPDYLTGLYLFNLPIEEVLFFICIPYAVVFTFFAMQYLLKADPFGKFNRLISLSLFVLSLFVFIVYFQKAYTALTALLLAIFSLYIFLAKKDRPFVYFSYLLIIPFFLLSNGLLTGSFLEEPIVWYDDNENLGLRIFTIPVEDSFYGLLLISLNIHLYQFFKERRTK